MISLASRGGNERRFLFGLQLLIIRNMNGMAREGEVPWTLKNDILHPNQLRDNTEDIQMRPIREEEIPQMKNLR